MKNRGYIKFIVSSIIVISAFMVGFYFKYESSGNTAVNGIPAEAATTVKGEKESIQEKVTKEGETKEEDTVEDKKNDFIKWVDFNVSYAALDTAYTYDVDSYKEEVKLNWIELLAYASAKNYGDFSSDKKIKKSMSDMAEALTNKEKTYEELTSDASKYDYFYEIYSAVLSGLVGEYEINGNTKYGLKGFSPIAKNFYYNDFDDFGVSRSYGYKRKHLGHDMMGQTGTPIVAVESGVVEAIGWNQYGGWRLGIRSFDSKRYYYYAHLRKNFPYCKTLKEGSIVTAGDIIGYLGRTGYSAKENMNNIDESHLHFGIQLIFDESQKEGASEIWIDPYNLIKFLYRNKCESLKDETSKEWVRIDQMKDPLVEQYKKKNGIK